MAEIIGFPTKRQTYPPRDFDRLMKLTAEVTGEHAPEFWQWMVNAKTGEPGAGCYRVP